MSPRNALRLISAGYQVARAGAFGLVDLADAPPQAARAVRVARWLEPNGLSDKERGARLTACLHRLGPSYVKLGQFLSTRPDIVGIEIADALAELKDQMPPFPTDMAKDLIRSSLETPAEELFEPLENPVAAASIAQVYKTRLKVPSDTAEESSEVVGMQGIPILDSDPNESVDLDATDSEEAEETELNDNDMSSTIDGEEALFGQECDPQKSVALKVLRPDIRTRFRKDLETFYAAARLAEKMVPDTQRLKPIAVVETLERTVTLEMDLRLEAAALSEMAEYTKDDTDFYVPKVYWENTGRDVLTTEWIDGIALSNLAEIDDADIDREALAATIVQSFLRHALQYGFFHADMHEGNLFVDGKGRLVAVDLGIMGRIGFKEQRFLAEILYGFIRRDYPRIAEVHFEAGYVPSKHSVSDFAQALRAIGEPIHGQSARDISMAKLLGLLFEITDIFDMQTRPELILLQKTMVVVEGVARRLDPNFDMWSSSEPVVRGWIEQHLGPAGQVYRAASNVTALGRLISKVPELAERTEQLSDDIDNISKNGLRLDQNTVTAIGRSEARHSRTGRWALWIIAIALVILAITAI